MEEKVDEVGLQFRVEDFRVNLLGVFMAVGGAGTVQYQVVVYK